MTQPSSTPRTESRTEARERVIVAALQVLVAERAEPHAHSEWETEYHDDVLVDAARALVGAADRESDA
jgi:hypothetical protein